MSERLQWREAVTFAYIGGTPIEKIARAFGCPGYLAQRSHALRGAGGAWKRQSEGSE
jgi:hypothetical protein